MATIDTLLEEIDASLEVMEPQHEGLRDFAMLDIQEDTKQEIDSTIRQFDRRLALILAAREALERLKADGWPTLTVREIDADELADLQENAATIQAALALFGSDQAVSLGLRAGPVEPKEL